MPKGKYGQLRAKLESQGIQVLDYTEGDIESRQAAIDTVEDLKFKTSKNTTDPEADGEGVSYKLMSFTFDGIPFTVKLTIRDKGKEQYQYLIEFKENKTPGLSNTAVKNLLRTDQVSYDDSIRNPQEKVNPNSTTESTDDPDIRYKVSAGDVGDKAASGQKKPSNSTASPLTRRPGNQGSVGSTRVNTSSTAAAELLNIDNINDLSDSVKQAISDLGAFYESVENQKPVLGFRKTITGSNLEGSLVLHRIFMPITTTLINSSTIEQLCDSRERNIHCLLMLEEQRTIELFISMTLQKELEIPPTELTVWSGPS